MQVESKLSYPYLCEKSLGEKPRSTISQLLTPVSSAQ